jgi:hypothetical protein
VARARIKSGLSFWTSIYEGNQKESESVGKLIEEHLKAKGKLMCIYNGTMVTRDEYIRLKHLEKLVADY